MTTSCKWLVYIVVFVGLIQSSANSHAQSAALDPQKWADELNKKGEDGNKSLQRIDSALLQIDSVRTFEFLYSLANKGTKDHHFQARFSCLLAHQIISQGFYRNKLTAAVLSRKEEIKSMFAYAMDQAYTSEDDHLIAQVSSWYGNSMTHFGEIGLAVMYGMNGIDLSEKVSEYIRPYDYQFLAEILYRVREYNSSIKYARKAADAWRKSAAGNETYTVSCLNTVALGYHRQDKYDSALFYYNQALELAKKANSSVWTGIVTGNMAQIYYAQKKYDSAYPIFLNDYKTSKDSGYYDNAANSLQWAARTNLALGDKSAALKQVREAFDLLRLWPDDSYLRNTYYTATQVFREMGSYDSAFYYNNLYASLNDSLERVVGRSTTDIAKARLNDEAGRYNIQTLNREKKSQLMLRNMIIVGIVLLSLFVLLIFNRKSLKAKMKIEKMAQEKLLMEQEVASAKDQLKLFTENVIEKTSLIEKLEMQVKGKEVTSEQHSIISELTQQTILTEQDWYKFRSLFEKIYPGFFIKLKDRFPDITVAEQRMAALTRLHLTTKQIASMLGISLDSVHKSRQRLRQRFQVGAETNLEELVANL
jgi:tetratricopeptide (TPR) repeat protein/DNA-binding CsgD family transcriptional regulator